MSGTSGRIKLPVNDQRVEDLLLWRDVKKSGAVFAGASAVFLFFQFAKYNFLSLFCYGLSLAVFTLLFWQVAAGILKKPPPPLPRIIMDGIPEAELRSYADRITPVINHGLSFTNRILGGSDPILSVMVGTGLFFTARIISSVSLLFLAYLPVLLAFSLPKVYELRKDEIDRAIDTGRTKITAINDKYLGPLIAMIPRAKIPAAAESSSTRKQQ